MYSNKSDIFFDLDHTLWDYDSNCKEALIEIFELFDLLNFGIKNPTDFIAQFHIANDKLWNLYDTRQITSDELRFRRFREIFVAFGIDDFSICDQLHKAYMAICPNKPHLMPGAAEILQYLSDKYILHIITNGIADNQTKKMKASGISDYFSTVTCSQKANARKPEKGIFEYAFAAAQTTITKAVMIGDNYFVDILGAKNIGLDYVYYNPNNKILEKEEKSMIKHLCELKQFL